MLDTNAISSLYFEVLYENPEIFYAASKTNISYSYYKGSGEIVYIKLNVEYLYENDEIKNMQSKFNEKVNYIMNNYLSGTKSEVELEYIIQNYILMHTTYDEENYNNGTIPDISHTAYGALVNGVAVCDGYSKAAVLLFNKVGIESGIITSSQMNHAWNYVNIDDKYYQLDITWDDPVTETNKIRYDYFNLSDDEMSEDHIWIDNNYPECKDDSFIFLRENNYNEVCRVNEELYYLKNGYNDYLILIAEIDNSYKIVKYNTETGEVINLEEYNDNILDIYVKNDYLYIEYLNEIKTISLGISLDINCDGQINIEDLSIISLRYGSDNNTNGWNYKYDLNGDKIIDIFDLVILTKEI